MQNICYLIGGKSVHISDILNYCSAISLQCETHENETGNTRHLNLH